MKAENAQRRQQMASFTPKLVTIDATVTTVATVTKDKED